MNDLKYRLRVIQKVKTHLLIFILSISATACSFDIEKARKISTIGNNFDQSLAREYQELALYEADEMYDWPDAALFSRKAIMASRGQSPVPEEIGDWNLPNSTVTEFFDARLLLINSLDSGFREEIPIQAAKAQASFDCWIEQQEEGWQFSHITKCKQNFRSAMGYWTDENTAIDTHQSNIYVPVHTAKIVSNVSAPKNKIERCNYSAQSHISSSKEFRINFQYDTAKLDPAADDTLIEVALHIRDVEVAEVFAEGHADLSGTNKYNLNLSLDRALAVWQRLISLGVPIEKLWLGPRGEEKPLSNAGNDAPNAQDRRVLVTIIEQNNSEVVGANDCLNPHMKTSEITHMPGWNGESTE